MEEYEGMESDAPDTYIAYDATATDTQEGNENEALHPSIEASIEKDHVPNDILKATSGNGRKRLGTRQETRAAARGSKNGVTASQHIATQERNVEKLRMQEWKRKIMDDVAHELQVMKDTQAEVMNVQREEGEKQRAHFQSEIELLKERICELEKGREKLTKEKKKEPESKLHAQRREPSQDFETVVPPDGEGSQEQQQIRAHTIKPSLPSQPKQTQSQKSYAQVVKEKSPRALSKNPWTEVRYTHKKQGASQKQDHKKEPGGRRILFPRKVGQPKKLEEDIMLALNEALQKAGEPASIRFSRVGYSQSDAISALLTDKADAAELLKTRINILIRAAKTVDQAVIGAETLERWHRLKVHGMSLERYLGEGKMALFKREVESSTGIELKTTPRWLVSEDRLR